MRVLGRRAQAVPRTPAADPRRKSLPSTFACAVRSPDIHPCSDGAEARLGRKKPEDVAEAEAGLASGIVRARCRSNVEFPNAWTSVVIASRSWVVAAVIADAPDYML